VIRRRAKFPVQKSHELSKIARSGGFAVGGFGRGARCRGVPPMLYTVPPQKQEVPDFMGALPFNRLLSGECFT
jgi:hypothetical protein